MTKSIELLSDFSDMKIRSTEDLINAIEAVRLNNDSSISNRRIQVNKDVSINMQIDRFRSKATIIAGNTKKFNMEGLIARIMPLLQKEGGSIVGIRHKSHVVQFISGHLTSDENGKEAPMDVIKNRGDKTMVKSLLTFKDPNTIKDSLDSMTNQYNLRDNDVKVKATLVRIIEDRFDGGSRKQVAQDLGFNVVEKESEGIIPNDNDDGTPRTCLATRMCIHTQQIEPESVPAEIIETLRLMRKLNKNPSIVMGVQGKAEIHINEKQISLNFDMDMDMDLFSKVLDSILNNIGVDFEKITIEYKEVKHNPKLEWLKSKIDDVTFNLEYNNEKIKASFMLTIIPLIFAGLLLQNLGLYISLMIVLPTELLIIFMTYLSKQSQILIRIGEKPRLSISMIALLFSVTAGLISFNGYMAIIEFVVVVVILLFLHIIVSTKTKAIETIENKFKLIFDKICQMFDNAIANQNTRTILILLAIPPGIAVVIIGGIAMAILFLVLAGIGTINAFFDAKFWRSVEEDRSRQIDRFFTDFRQQRPELSNDCEVSFNIKKCKVLRNPVKSIPAVYFKYLKYEYPDFLCINNIKKNGYKLLTGRWIIKE